MINTITPRLADLVHLLRHHSPVLVITGAGISAASGIPTYRNDEGEWQHRQPITHQEFLSSHQHRQRYWSRSAVGWPQMAAAQPNLAHQALAKLESAGRLSTLVTQNVDGLHQRAGHHRVIDLHGRVDHIVCQDCGHSEARENLQTRLMATNPHLKNIGAESAPDGDAYTPDELSHRTQNPSCEQCGGIPMPDVVFYGGTVPKQRVATIQAELEKSQSLLVVGSSLSVYSAFRFCREAANANKPIAIINRGITRADNLARIKLEADCGQSLAAVAEALT